MKTYRPLSIIIAMISLLFFPLAWADKAPSYVAPVKTMYSVVYSQHSKVKGPDLKETTLTIFLYNNGNPVGSITPTTNKLQKFAFYNKYGNALVMDVIAVKGTPKTMRCKGMGRGKDKVIKLTCSKVLK